MPVLESNESIGWKGIEGNTSGHPGYVTIPAGIPTFVSETDWEVGRKLEEIRRRLATNVMRISSKLTAAIAMAIVPSAEILRLADAEESKAPELKSAALPDAAAVKAAAEHIGTTSTRLAEVLRDVPAALASAEQPDVPESVAIEVPEAVEPVVEAPAPSDPEVVAEPVIEPPPEESKPAVAPEDPAAERVATTVMPPVPTETKPRRRSR